MPDLAAELYAIQHLAALSAMSITNIRDAKFVFGPAERGLDVVFDLDRRRIGAQHTIYHGDEGHAPGKRGSHVRATEESTARRTQSRPSACGALRTIGPRSYLGSRKSAPSLRVTITAMSSPSLGSSYRLACRAGEQPRPR